MFTKSLTKAIRNRIATHRMRKLSKLTIEEAFDRIYEDRVWSNGSEELSGGGSYGETARHYVAYVTGFIKTNAIGTILDVGCGDFNIGSQIAPLVSRYTAIDVSSRIIELNKKKYADLENVEFRKANACVDELIETDLVTIRQVLQHLTNGQIELILQNVERANPRFVLVAEHISGDSTSFVPNLDLPSHSSDTRLALGSGVVLTAAPFNRTASLVETICLPGYDRSMSAAPDVLGIFLLTPRG